MFFTRIHFRREGGKKPTKSSLPLTWDFSVGFHTIWGFFFQKHSDFIAGLTETTLTVSFLRQKVERLWILAKLGPLQPRVKRTQGLQKSIRSPPRCCWALQVWPRFPVHYQKAEPLLPLLLPSWLLVWPPVVPAQDRTWLLASRSPSPGGGEKGAVCKKYKKINGAGTIFSF